MRRSVVARASPVSLCPPRSRPSGRLLQATLLLYTCARLGKDAERWARCEERAGTSETAGILPGVRKHLRGRGGRGALRRGGRDGGSNAEEPARLLIADDHALVREGLRTMLSGEDGIQVIAEANDGQEALSMCRDLRPISS